MARDGLRSHLSGSVPVSIVAHLVVLLVLVVIPLANIVLPIPFGPVEPIIIASALPLPPEPAPKTRSPVATPSASGNFDPTSVPTDIRPETPSTPPATMTTAEGGIGSAIGDATGVDGGLGAPPPPPPVPEPPRPQTPVRAAQLPELPRKTVDVRPMYPEVARIARVQGTVILEAVLDTSGRVTQLKVIRSVPLLDQAAVDAVRQWRYTPSIYAGRPVSVLMTITVRFTLSE
jgi:protein TonB